ncbi:hypothetical protein M0805_000678, partial [Coniferiporia weirii]
MGTKWTPESASLPDNPYTEALWMQASSSTPSLSSNATADNLPGPGRTIGLLYSYAGRIIERLVNTRSPADGVAPFQEMQEMPNDNSSTSSNATAPDLPGAGRTIGLFYTFAGNIIEHSLNKLAKRWGAGPYPVARKVHRYFELTDRDTWSTTEFSLVSSKENKKVKRQIITLLKHARSNFEINQVNALNQIIGLAIYHPHARELLNVLNAMETVHDTYLRAASASRNDCDVLLHSSRRALIALTEMRVNSVGHTLSAHRFTGASLEARDMILTVNLQELLEHMPDPDLSFLVLRHLRYAVKDGLYMGHGGGFLRSDILPALTEVLSAIPEHIECETVEHLLKSLLQIYSMHYFYLTQSEREKWVPLFAIIFQHAQKFGRFFGMLDLVYVNASVEEHRRRGSYFEFSPQHVELVMLLLRGISSSRLDRESSILLLDSDAIKAECVEPSLSNVWDTLLSKPYVVLVQILHWRNVMLERDRANAMLINRVAEGKRLSLLCMEMGRLFEEELQPSQYDALTRMAKFAQIQDRYCARAMTTALSTVLARKRVPPVVIPQLRQLLACRETLLQPDVRQTSEYISIPRHAAEGRLLHVFN